MQLVATHEASRSNFVRFWNEKMYVVEGGHYNSVFSLLIVALCCAAIWLQLEMIDFIN
jgi:hypothetical protein